MQTHRVFIDVNNRGPMAEAMRKTHSVECDRVLRHHDRLFGFWCAKCYDSCILTWCDHCVDTPGRRIVSRGNIRYISNENIGLHPQPLCCMKCGYTETLPFMSNQAGHCMAFEYPYEDDFPAFITNENYRIVLH